ncbi:MAG: hypothetical protein ABSG96_25705, partial [Terracidiphilus sp.]
TYFGFYLAVVFLTVIVNLDESTLFGAPSLAWMFYLLACIGLRHEAREAFTQGHQAGTAR